MDFSWSIFYEWLVEIKAQGFKTKPGANNERVQKNPTTVYLPVSDQ